MVLNVFINLDTNLLILDPGHCICWTHTTGQNAPRRRKMKILRYYTFSLWFIDKRQEWQSYHCGMEMIFKTNLIAFGLDWSWNEIWKSPNSWWLAFHHVTEFLNIFIWWNHITCFVPESAITHSCSSICSLFLHFFITLA